MSFIISTKAELIKTKRSASFWLSLIGSAVIPLIFFLVYVLEPKNASRFQVKPWELHFTQGWQAFAAFLLPMFVILICSLIPQIEFKNNTWKQVFASPQSVGNIFFSKYLSIIIMILFL
ncbi:MAG TPA: ABC transporter permease, partial [Chitinophagaceae bacterium]|nr:ABC transporter permease [Chitinophagaceae bacterium]